MIKEELAILSIDFGSTQTKFDPNFETRGQKSRFDFKPNTDTIESRYGNFRLLRQEKIDQLFVTLRTSIKDFYEDTEDDDYERFITITGFTNSLALVYRDENGKDHYAVLLDEPSLSTDLNENQKKILEKYGIDHNKKITSLQKILALKNHPEILESIFGEKIDFSQLRFSTMFGLINWELNGKNPQKLEIPYADLVGFGKKDITPEKLRELLKELGISESQFKIGGSYFEQTLEGITFAVNDFESELRLIAKLRETNVVDKEGIIIGFDSVGKIIFPDNFKEETSEFKEIPERYTTQRMSGNIISEWLKHFGFVDKKGNNKYKEIDNFINQILKTSNQITSSFFYFPNSGNKGQLIKVNQETGEKTEILPEKVKDLSEDDKKQAFIAVVFGMLFGIRKKIESTLRANNYQEKPTIYIYGGLTEKHTGWQQAIKLVLKDISSDVLILDIPNANIPTRNFLSFQILGKNTEVSKISKSNIEEKNTNDLENYWNLWSNFMNS